PSSLLLSTVTAPTASHPLSLHDALPILLTDAQAPYDPPSEELAGVVVPVDAPPQHRTHMWIERVRTGVIELDRSHLAYVRRLYRDRKSTRLNSSHVKISYAVFCLKKKTT